MASRAASDDPADRLPDAATPSSRAVAVSGASFEATSFTASSASSLRRGLGATEADASEKGAGRATVGEASEVRFASRVGPAALSEGRPEAASASPVSATEETASWVADPQPGASGASRKLTAVVMEDPERRLSPSPSESDRLPSDSGPPSDSPAAASPFSSPP